MLTTIYYKNSPESLLEVVFLLDILMPNNYSQTDLAIT